MKHTKEDLERFWSKVEKKNKRGCWVWTSATKTKDCYGVFYLKKTIAAHRFSYELVKGKIPEEYELDHLCRNPTCVNPNHLEAVSHQENIKRGESFNRNKTNCKRGHPLEEYNLILIQHKGRTFRNCRICHNRNVLRYQRRLEVIVK